MQSILRKGPKLHKTIKINYRNKEQLYGIAFALPAILGLLIFTVGPMIASAFMSFTDWRIGSTPNFIGFTNFTVMFTSDKLFAKSLGVTFYYALGSVPLVLISSFFVAILLNRKIKGLAFFRTIFYMPSIVPVIASSMLWMWLFNPDFGLLNNILQKFGFAKQLWIYDEKTVIPALIVMAVWGMGGTMIIFLAGLQGVPTSLYEAIEIDGGSWWHKLRYITIPMMTPTIFFNLIMLIISNLQAFGQAYVMTEGGPNNASLFYVFYLYRTAFTHSELGYACALAWVLFIIIMILTAIVFKTSNKWVYYEGAK